MSDDQDRLGNVPRILNHNKTRWEWISLHFPSYSNTRLSRSATIRESHSCFQYSSFLFCQEQTISQYFGGNRYPFTKTQAHVAAYRRIISPNSRRVSQGNLTTWEPANITRWSEEQAWFFGVFKVQICIIWVIYCLSNSESLPGLLEIMAVLPCPMCQFDTVVAGTAGATSSTADDFLVEGVSSPPHW